MKKALKTTVHSVVFNAFFRNTLKHTFYSVEPSFALLADGLRAIAADDVDSRPIGDLIGRQCAGARPLTEGSGVMDVQADARVSDGEIISAESDVLRQIDVRQGIAIGESAVADVEA